jgi:hypothetical protein
MARLNLRTRRNKIVAAGAAVLMVAGAGAAYAWWSSLGTGTSTQTNSAGAADMSVTSPDISGLVPGGSVALSGRIVNAAGPDASVGTVLATVGSVTAGPLSDYWVTGSAVVDANVPTGSQGIAWSGLTLHYGNAPIDQNSGKSAKIVIDYTLTPMGSTIVGKSAVPRTASEQTPCAPLDSTGMESVTPWANSTSTRNYALTETSPNVYLVTVDYTGGTFTTIPGAPQPGNCAATNPTAISGTMDQTWSATINTALPANHAPDCSGTVQYGPKECIGISGFLTAVFGSAGASLQPSMQAYTWHDTFTAGGNTWYDVSAPSISGAPVWPAGNSGNIK